MTEPEVIQALAALAHDKRLQAFRALVASGLTGLTPTSLSEAVGLAPNALSFHLKGLLHAGLITQERQGRHLVYRAQFPAVNALLGYLTENCCQGAGCVPSSDACASDACDSSGCVVPTDTTP